MKRIFLLIGVALFAAACNDYTPKPMGYNRIDLKEPSYKEYKCGMFSFLYSEFARIDNIQTSNNNDLWFNIVYPSLNAQIHFSYIPVNNSNFRSVLEDSRHFAYGHVLKADGISQTLFENPVHNTSGIIYEIEGNVATPIQFFITDSISNFLRASFYYDTQVRQDSVSPVTEYIRNDIIKLLESFEWKKP